MLNVTHFKRHKMSKLQQSFIEIIHTTDKGKKIKQKQK